MFTSPPMEKRNMIWRILLISAVLLSFFGTLQTSATPQISSNATPKRRINVTQGMEFSQTAIFWFGVNDSPQYMPGRNYADVRIRYTENALEIKIIGIDYYLWYDDSNQPGDLTQYDAVAVYFDTGHNQGSTPQQDDYYFLLGARNWEDPARYRRQARGTGSGWDPSWSASWTNNFYGAWENGGGYNINNGYLDFGWDGTFIIPWSVFGLSAPPPTGTLWGLGVQLYDRDSNDSSGLSAPEYWPETFSGNNPSTWGELHFGAPDFVPPSGSPNGTITIQGNSAMEDAWVGGGPHGISGHIGDGSNLNHGDDRDLFVGNEMMPVHFPYFDKSFFRFPLSAVPAGVDILSAELYLYHWGNAEPSLATDSWLHLFTISDDWGENTITWNNAPLAQENIALTWMAPIRGNGYADPPIEYAWNATQAVAEAYATGQSVSMAIYSSDVDQHSNRYFYGSEADDWLAAYRPKLVITYGNQTPQLILAKSVNTNQASYGDTLSYSLTWNGTDQEQTLNDILPQGLSSPTNLSVNIGSASYNINTHQITWIGMPSATESVELTYQASIQIEGPIALVNTATLSDDNASISDSVGVCVDCPQTYLPLIFSR